MSELLKNETVDERQDGWKCENDQDAEWCLTQIKRAKEEKERWKAHYDAMFHSVSESCDATIANMEHFLLEYFKTVPHKVTKTEENYALPSGKIMMKAQDTSFEYNESELIDWLKTNGKGFIKTKESVDWDGLKKTLSIVGDTVADGDAQIIPCITATEREPIFKVQIKK